MSTGDKEQMDLALALPPRAPSLGSAEIAALRDLRAMAEAAYRLGNIRTRDRSSWRGFWHTLRLDRAGLWGITGYHLHWFADEADEMCHILQSDLPEKRRWSQNARLHRLAAWCADRSIKLQSHADHH